MPKAKIVSQDTMAIASNVYEFCKAEAAAAKPLVPLQYPLKRASGMTKKVQVGKDQEKAQSEKDSHSKYRGGKKPN